MCCEFLSSPLLLLSSPLLSSPLPSSLFLAPLLPCSLPYPSSSSSSTHLTCRKQRLRALHRTKQHPAAPKGARDARSASNSNDTDARAKQAKPASLRSQLLGSAESNKTRVDHRQLQEQYLDDTYKSVLQLKHVTKSTTSAVHEGNEVSPRFNPVLFLFSPSSACLLAASFPPFHSDNSPPPPSPLLHN